MTYNKKLKTKVSKYIEDNNIISIDKISKTLNLTPSIVKNTMKEIIEETIIDIIKRFGCDDYFKNEKQKEEEIKKASIDIFNKFIGLKCPLEENAENKKVIRNKGDLENFVYEYFFDKNILIIKEVEYVV